MHATDEWPKQREEEARRLHTLLVHLRNALRDQGDERGLRIVLVARRLDPLRGDAVGGGPLAQRPEIELLELVQRHGSGLGAAPRRGG